MKYLTATLLLACAPAFAFAPPQAVASECFRQMQAGVCAVKPDPNASYPETMVIAGVGQVSFSAYLDYLRLYNETVPTDPAMCALALEKMTTEPGGDHDKIARAKWTPVEPMRKPVNVPSSALAVTGAMLLAIAMRRRREFVA